MSVTYKLSYFNLRARGEIIRLMFAYANVKYEDVRYELNQWPQIKPTLPLGKCPVLYVDGQPIADSGSATRYLARKFGLTGKSEIETAQADVFLEAVRDLVIYRARYMMEKNETKKAHLVKTFYDEQIPPFFDNMEKLLKANGGTYFVGKGVTYADLAVVDGVNELAIFSPDPKLLDKHQLLKGLIKRIHEIPSIKKWLETRPKTIF